MVSFFTLFLLISFAAIGFILFKASETSADAAGIRLTGVIVLLLVFILTLVGIWNATRIIIHTLTEITSYAKNISMGNTDIEVIVHNQNEMGRLAQTFKEMQTAIKNMVVDVEAAKDNILSGNIGNRIDVTGYSGDYQKIMSGMNELLNLLCDTVRRIQSSSDNVAAAAGQISGSSQTLAEGSTEQASAIEQLSASITEVAGKVKANASDALAASRLADRASSEVERGNEHMEQMMNAISDIRESSGKIGNIIKAIEDIAFQTNILALNAAVEAARAGSAGRGFAVVADEVRNLAGKSAEAVKNTTALIENSTAAVEHGINIAEDTDKSLEIIFKTTKRVADLIGNISNATHEQEQTISQITQGVDQISAVIQTNSATSEESAAASEELDKQAQRLKELVSYFKIDAGDADTDDPEQSREMNIA